MNTIVRQDLLHIIDRAREILQRRDAAQLKELSNHTIHDASIFQDEDSVDIAVVIYALSKLLERTSINVLEVEKMLADAQRGLWMENIAEYRQGIQRIIKRITSIDTQLKLYVDEVIGQAQIKKGSKLYDHGISLALSASIFNVSEWELMNYVGKTHIVDAGLGVSSVKKRLGWCRELFK